MKHLMIFPTCRRLSVRAALLRRMLHINPMDEESIPSTETQRKALSRGAGQGNWVDSRIQLCRVFPIRLYHVVKNKFPEHKSLPFSKKKKKVPKPHRNVIWLISVFKMVRAVFLAIAAHKQELTVAKWGIFQKYHKQYFQHVIIPHLRMAKYHLTCLLSPSKHGLQIVFPE